MNNIVEEHAGDSHIDFLTEDPDEQIVPCISGDADFSGSWTSTYEIHSSPSDKNSDRWSFIRSDRLKVFWPEDQQFYCGTVKHLHRNGEITVLYDDGEDEHLNMDKEIWKFDLSIATACASTGQAFNEIHENITDAEPAELKCMIKVFGNKSFLKHQAQGFEQYVLEKAYKAEEVVFLNTVKVIPHQDLPKEANEIRSHRLYKIETNDDGLYTLKARIEPHGNEGAILGQLSSDCATCSPAGFQIVESIEFFKASGSAQGRC